MTGWEEDQNNNPVGDLLLLSNNLWKANAQSRCLDVCFKAHAELMHRGQEQGQIKHLVVTASRLMDNPLGKVSDSQERKRWELQETELLSLLNVKWP